MTPQAETISDTPVWKRTSLWVAAIAVFGTLLNGAMMLKSTHNQLEFEQMKIVMDRLSVEVDQAKIREDRNLKTIIEQGVQIINLTSQVKDRTTQLELLNGFVESVPLSAWIKIRGPDGIFRIVTINEQFTVNYGLTKKQSVGFSDYDFYPDNPELADSFQEGDRLVYESGRDLRRKGKVLKNGVIVEREYIKFPISLPSGFEGIGGLIIE